MPLMEQGAVGEIAVSIAGLTTLTLSTANNSADQARYLAQNYTGALTGNCTVTMPNVNRVGWAVNSTTGGHNVILTTGGGTNATIPPDGHWYFWQADGATNTALIPIGFGALAATTVTATTVTATTGNITTVNATTGNITTVASTTGNITTVNATTVTTGVGNITTVNAGTLSTSGLATVAALASVGAAVCDTTLEVGSTVVVHGDLEVVGTGSMLLQPAAPGVGFAWISFNAGASNEGSISFTGSGVSYNTSSDYRLKVTFGIAETGDMIDAVTIHDASFLANPTIRAPMFLAHELAEVAPYAVTGAKDAVNDDGSIIPQMVDNSKLVPALWAELKALRKRVADLEAR